MQSAESLIVQDFFEPGIGETLHAVRQLLSSTEHVETAMRLESASAMPLIELLDQVPVDLDDHLFLSAFHTLKKLCALHLYLPRSFMFTDDLRKMSDQAETSGAFADIWHGCYNGLNVAVKSIRIFNSIMVITYDPQGFCTEAVIWRHLSHPNVTPFLGINTTQFRLSMVCKWMPKGNIRSYIHAHPSADRPMLVMDVARGLEYLHSMGVVHGDMKGANILVNGEGRACLSDFGLAAVIYDDSTVNVATTASFATGTIRWMAPEILDPERAGIDVALALPESDVYSYAMVVWEIFTGRSPFDKQRLDAAVMYQILSGVRPEYTPEAIVLGLSEDMWQLIELCWHPDRSQRPNMYEVVSKLRTILRIPSTPASKHPRRRRELQNLHVAGAGQVSRTFVERAERDKVLRNSAAIITLLLCSSCLCTRATHQCAEYDVAASIKSFSEISKPLFLYL
ncbi:kinase-like protein [Wolfiporia cocos MD-104 SS10]|uniref:Kinase-like protein n=1 Tax=Wolfiporia cocos (strain MD-104) TaxID=742152 RepID=A0A2H3JM95_WOLCO|nr:kinase-like protein [Wolfiporia cocos MD-104 SS10]